MSEKETKTGNQAVKVDDLPVDEARQDEVKGGAVTQTRIPIFICPSDPS